MTRRGSVLFSVVVATAGFLLCLALTRDTPNVGVDGVVYLATASNIRDGRGITTPFTFVANAYPPRQAADFDGEVPLTHFPPLYPVAIGMVSLVGLSLSESARWLGALTLAIDLVLFGFLVRRATAVRSWLLPSAAVALLLLGPAATYGFGIGVGSRASWLALSGSVFAESLFLAWCLSGLLLLARWLRDPRPRWLVLVAASAAAATLTRFAGVSLVACAGLVVLAWGAGPIRRRGRAAALVVAGGLLPPVLWSLMSVAAGGESARAIVLHAPNQNVSRLLANGSLWVFPSSVPDRTRQVLFVIVLGGFLALAIDLIRLRARDPGTGLRRTLAVFAVCYLGTVEITRFFLDIATPIDGRLLSPLQPVVYALILGVLVTWMRARFSVTIDRAGAIAAVVAALVTLAGIGTTIDGLRDGFVPAPDQSALGHALDALPAGVPLVTNDPLNVWTASGRDSLVQPQRVDYTTGEVDPAFRARLAGTLRFLQETDGRYVYSPARLYGTAQPSSFRAGGLCLGRARDLPDGWSAWKPVRCRA